MKSLLSPKDLAQVVGVSESSLKRWADNGLIKVVRTAGGHRKINRNEAIQFIREQGLPILRPDILGLSELSGDMDSLVEPDNSLETLKEALIKGSENAVRGIILTLYLGGMSFADIFDGPVRQSLEEIGQIWRHSEEGIFIEHRATHICQECIHLLNNLLPALKDNAPVALGGAPTGDPYSLPSLMASATLSAEGWQAMNLGTNTPLDIIPGAAEKTSAELVWITLSHLTDSKATKHSLIKIADNLKKKDVKLIVGGRACPARLHLEHPTIQTGRTMAELAAFARGLAANRIKKMKSKVRFRR